VLGNLDRVFGDELLEVLDGRFEPGVPALERLGTFFMTFSFADVRETLLR
jgi:hypothetical protein